jgi:hypothetical protein
LRRKTFHFQLFKNDLVAAEVDQSGEISQLASCAIVCWHDALWTVGHKLEVGVEAGGGREGWEGQRFVFAALT